MALFYFSLINIVLLERRNVAENDGRIIRNNFQFILTDLLLS
jgi:hypothetical protein